MDYKFTLKHINSGELIEMFSGEKREFSDVECWMRCVSAQTIDDKCQNYIFSFNYAWQVEDILKMFGNDLVKNNDGITYHLKYYGDIVFNFTDPMMFASRNGMDKFFEGTRAIKYQLPIRKNEE